MGEVCDRHDEIVSGLATLQVEMRHSNRSLVNIEATLKELAKPQEKGDKGDKGEDGWSWGKALVLLLTALSILVGTVAANSKYIQYQNDQPQATAPRTP
jgi:hypothetical protein